MYSGLISFSESGIVNKMTGQGDVIPKPYLTISKSKEVVKIEFDMDRQEAIQIYCKRGKDSDFELLAEVEDSPYYDTRANLTVYSEEREYKAIFSCEGEPIGEPDFLTIKTKGRFRFF
jgi:hypothetical protein